VKRTFVLLTHSGNPPALWLWFRFDLPSEGHEYHSGWSFSNLRQEKLSVKRIAPCTRRGVIVQNVEPSDSFFEDLSRVENNFGVYRLLADPHSFEAFSVDII
jgi:hypothetical protein